MFGNPIESVGFLAKARFAIGLVCVFLVFGVLIMNIFNATGYAINTKDYRPLLDSTIGRFFIADKEIHGATTQLLNPSITMQFATFLKQSIMTNLIFIAMFFYAVFWIFKKLFSLGTPYDQMTFWFKALLFLIAFVFLTLSFIIYQAIMFDSFEMPYKGITGLVVHRDVFVNWGSFEMNGTLINQNVTDIMTSQAVNTAISSVGI